MRCRVPYPRNEDAAPARSSDEYDIVDDPWELSLDLKKLRKRYGKRESPREQDQAFALLAAIVEEIGPAVWDADDHEGVLMGTVSEALDDIRALAAKKDASPACLARIRAWARANAESDWAVNGDSWDFELIRIVLTAARGESERTESLEFCERYCVPKEPSFHARFLAEDCGGLILESLSRKSDAEARSAFIQANMHLDAALNAAISDALSRGAMRDAESLAREGMERAKKKDERGTADRYADRLIEVLESDGRRDEALAMLESWMIRDSSMTRFEQLKKQVPGPAAWQETRERILRTLSARSPSFAADICAKEGLIERLYELASTHPSIMDSHCSRIGKLYPEPAAKHIAKKIHRSLERTTTRGEYSRIAGDLREYGRFAGGDAAARLADELIARYPNRPAMAQELKKAIKRKKR